MCDFCKKQENALDGGWLRQKDGSYKSCCYDCGLKEEGEFTDRI